MEDTELDTLHELLHFLFTEVQKRRYYSNLQFIDNQGLDKLTHNLRKVLYLVS